MALSAGAPTAAATAASPAGTSSGDARCARPSTSCATPLVPLTEQEGASSSTTSGPRATPTSRSFSTAATKSVDRFLAAITRRTHSPTAERVRALELMEMQRHAQLMYTSCGWFFDDISGIETVQVIAYAARVLQLAKELFGEQAADLEPAFLARLAEANSNDAAAGDGARIYKENALRPCSWNSSRWPRTTPSARVFSSFAEETELFCYRVRRISYEIYTSGRGRLALGRVHVASAITGKRRPSPSPCSTSAIRTSPPPSNPTPTPMRPPLRHLRPRRRSTCSAPTFPR